MQFHEFLGQVQHRARLSSLGEADVATRATLKTLAERLAGGEPKDIAAQLPESIAKYLAWEGAAAPQRFSPDEFVQRVSERAGVDRPAAAHQARAVISVLREAVTPGEFDDVRAQLPKEYDQLFAPDGSR